MRSALPFCRCFTFLLLLTIFHSCAKLRGYYGSKNYDPVQRSPNPSDILLPEGYKIEVVCTGLNFPAGLTFDDEGALCVVEAGYSYGEIFSKPRLLRIGAGGDKTAIVSGGNNGPWTAVDYADGNFYISEGGAMSGGRILKVASTGEIEPLAQDMPSYGDHHTNGVVVGKDGYIYFGQGTATNSGIVGEDNFMFGWLNRKREFHDIPCEDITLLGENYETGNVLSSEKEKVQTGAFVPYGTETKRGQVVKGSIPCSGAIMRIPLKGGALELVAWGFRNPFGIAFAPDGSLYATDNGYDIRGSRPVFGAADLLWKVERGAWYGWPEFSGGDSITSKDYRARKIRPKRLLMHYPGTPRKPTAIFGVHSSSNGFAFSKNPAFGFSGDAFVAQFGDMSPDVGTVYTPVGFKIVHVNVSNGNVSDFAVNRGSQNGPASFLKNGGLERPVAVKFNKDGTALYVVDFGIMEITEKGPAPKQNTGVIWKITKAQ